MFQRTKEAIINLREVHILFITAATGLSLFGTYWTYQQSQNVDAAGYMAASAMLVIAAVGLIAYGFFFLRKTR